MTGAADRMVWVWSAAIMIGDLCGAEMNSWRTNRGEILARVQLASLQIFQKSIVQATMVYCRLTSALVCVTARATQTVHTATADQKLASSSPDLRKPQTCVVLLDAENTVLALRAIWAADSR